MFSRREFLQIGALSSAAVLSAGVPNLSAQSQILQKEEVDIPVHGLGSAFEGYRIGLISDFHLGVHVPHEWVEDAVQQLNASNVDVILFAGDYIGYKDSLKNRNLSSVRNPSFHKFPQGVLAAHMFECTADLLSSARAKDGVYAVFGNHDRHVPLDHRANALFEKGVYPLVNDFAEVRRGKDVLRIIGLDDLLYGRPNLPQLPTKKHANETRLLLVHNPDLASHVLKHTDFEIDLGLAGHTHGGQIKLPLFGALEYNVQDLHFKEGLNKHKQTFVYTTRGIGVVKLPWRINCPPEVNVISLRQA